MKFISATDSVGLHNHWWNKFINAVWNETNNNHDLFLVNRDNMLLKYGAVVVTGGIKFETDEQATWFLLRWS